jgi:hypothetical protein
MTPHPPGLLGAPDHNPNKFVCGAARLCYALGRLTRPRVGEAKGILEMNIKNLLVGGAMAITALAATTAVNATTTLYSVSDGSGVILSGDFTTNALGQVLTMTGTLGPGALPFFPIGGVSFTPNPNGSAATNSPSGFFTYDDVFSTTPGSIGFDNNGLLFFVGGTEYNLFSNAPGYSAYVLYNNNGQNEPVTFSAAIPEPATWAMMILGIGLLGAGLRLGSKKPEPALA